MELIAAVAWGIGLHRRIGKGFGGDVNVGDFEPGRPAPGAGACAVCPNAGPHARATRAHRTSLESVCPGMVSRVSFGFQASSDYTPNRLYIGAVYLILPQAHKISSWLVRLQR